MDNNAAGTLFQGISSLIRQAHHEVCSNVDGNDEAWPLWYAEYLQKPFGKLILKNFTHGQLIYFLIATKRKRLVAEADRAEFYSPHFFLILLWKRDLLRPSSRFITPPWRPFCQLVLQSNKKLGLI